MLVWDNLCRNSCIMMHKRERFLVVRFARNIERDVLQGTNYLTELMLWSILQGGNSAPEDELHLCGAARRSSAPGAVHLEQNLGAKLLE